MAKMTKMVKKIAKMTKIVINYKIDKNSQKWKK